MSSLNPLNGEIYPSMSSDNRVGARLPALATHQHIPRHLRHSRHWRHDPYATAMHCNIDVASAPATVSPCATDSVAAGLPSYLDVTDTVGAAEVVPAPAISPSPIAATITPLPLDRAIRVEVAECENQSLKEELQGQMVLKEEAYTRIGGLMRENRGLCGQLADRDSCIAELQSNGDNLREELHAKNGQLSLLYRTINSQLSGDAQTRCLLSNH